MPKKRRWKKNRKTENPSGTPQPRSRILKDKGNRALQNGDPESALGYYSEAIEEDEDNHTLYSNRALCHLKLQDYTAAFGDAQKCIDLKNDWAKGYRRRGNAQEGMMRLFDAQKSFQQGLDLDPTNRQMLIALTSVMERIKEQKSDEGWLEDDNKSVGGNHVQTNKFKDFMKWLIEGGCIFPKLYLKFYNPEYRAIHANQKVLADEKVLFVPHNMIMTSDMAKQSEIGSAIIKSKVELRSKHSFLAALLLQEMENPNSKWKPYLDILPKKFDTVPLFFDEVQKKELEGSISLQKIQERLMSLKSEYDNICEAVPQFKRFRHMGECPNFVWARLVVITRIFGLVIDGVKTDGLVPMADMLNHKRPRETKWTYDQKRRGFCITALQNIRSDAEIFDSYGRKCNSRFFVNYGFSLESNKDNEASLSFTLDNHNPQHLMKLQMLGERTDESTSHTRHFQIPMSYTEKKVKECFSFLRFMHAAEKELMLISTDLQSSAVGDIQPLSVWNEKNVLLRLIRSATTSLRRFNTSLEEDNRMLDDEKNYPLLSNKRNIVLMRRGEKEVLSYYIRLAKECFPMFDMQWKELKKLVAHKYKSNSQEPISLYVRNVVVALVKRSS